MIKRKIISTLGPSSFNELTIHKMDNAGVDIFRINLSHTKIEEFEGLVKMLSKWTSKPICPDSEGAQLRSGFFPGNGIEINAYDIFEIVPMNLLGNKQRIPVTVPDPSQIFLPGDLLKIDFDSVSVQITKVKDGFVEARAIQGGRVGCNKGISIDRPIHLPTFTEKDMQAFKISNQLGLKTVFLSFASSGEDVKQLRSFFDYEIEVVSKIESKIAILNLEGICSESNAVLIDRGDLSRDVPLEKIIFAQSYILKQARSFSAPVYVATNLMENMIQHSKPTRAEVSDIVGILNDGADGLVLAAETAIGKYPADCVRIMSRIIYEVENGSGKDNIEYLFSLPSDRIIEPHGGELVQQHYDNLNDSRLADLPILEVDSRIISDTIQIAEGTYSPVTSFMDLDEVWSVLEKMQLRNGVVWTIPIIFQVKENVAKKLPHSGEIILKCKQSGHMFALLKISKVQRIESLNLMAQKWFGSDDINHPGVSHLLQNGDYLLSGEPLLFKKAKSFDMCNYELTPKQTRTIFNDAGWHNIIGYHTRNVAHRGHEYIQKKALESTGADAIFISPVTGIKKSGDFTGNVIILCYEEIIRSGYYNPYGVLLGSFNTYSRYSGPREAVFTAICRKNFGCNYFIVGRDHTGVGNYYAQDASQRIFDSLDIGMEIVNFDTVYFCEERGIATTDFENKDDVKNLRKSLSGTDIRNLLKDESTIPEYLVRPEVAFVLRKLYKNNPDLVFEK